MRAPLSWLCDFAPFEAPVGDLVDALNRIGLVVEGVAEPGAEIGGVRTVRVLGIEDHPDADRLVLVDVDHGAGQARVVCGARNYAPGDVVPWAAPGAVLPGGFRITSRKIRGRASDGMLCSAKELGVSDDHSGIMILPEATPLGADVRAVLGLDDVIFDLEITANRPDAMSVAGVARDLAAALRIPFTLPTPPPSSILTGDGRLSDEWATVVVEAPDRCPRYVARCGRVTAGEAPAWMAQRLTKAGMRTISGVVDVTNYVMLERGQPLHAFDLALLGGRGICVRLAADGERVSTLDGVERVLTGADLLICDAERVPRAVAGVMGGTDSEVSDSTAEVLLESAYFTPAGILGTSKRLGLRTESSARFERGVDPGGTAAAADRAWELLAEVAGGQSAAGALDAYPTPVERTRIRLRTARLNAVLGTALSAVEAEASLLPLGLELVEASSGDANGGAEATEWLAPTFRPDLEREIDLVEEVARHHGYNNIARTMPRMSQRGAGLTPHQRSRMAVREALAGRGLHEAITFSLLSPADLAAAGLAVTHGSADGHADGHTDGHTARTLVELENPLRAEESLLRPSLLAGLLRAVGHNSAQGQSDVGLFEIGHVFAGPAAGQVLPDEREHLAVVVAGRERRLPYEADRPLDAHDAVGHLRAVAATLGLSG
ncbi:MAG: phenylalanine--tRNA ligase subunit beta, partial [Acidimicrobiia bacterium]